MALTGELELSCLVTGFVFDASVLFLAEAFMSHKFGNAGIFTHFLCVLNAKTLVIRSSA